MIDPGFIVSIFLTLIVVLVSLYLKKNRAIKFQDSLDKTLYLIRMPKYENEKNGQQDVKELIALMEQVYANFLYLRYRDLKRSFFSDPPTVTLEVASEIGGSDIAFYVSVSTRIGESLEKYIQGVYPGAIVEKVIKDYTIFEPKSFICASYAKLEKEDILPLTTYKDLAGDPIASITNAMSKIQPDEGCCMQIVLRPNLTDLKEKAQKRVDSILNPNLQNREKIYSAWQSQSPTGLIGEVFGSHSQDNQYQQDLQNQYLQQPIDQNQADAIRKKISKPLFDVNIRLVGVAKNELRAEDILHSLESGLAQFFSNYNNFRFVPVKKYFIRDFIFNYCFRNFIRSQNISLNAEELAGIYHFPLAYIESPNLIWAKTKEIAPPSELPKTGPMLIGKSIYRGEEKNVYFSNDSDRRRHFYIIGQTGTGKTSLMQEMICQDIANGKGVGVIDPHGDLVESILANIPKSRADDVILFEPFDIENPMGLNMLEWETSDQKDFLVSEMIMIFSKLFPPEIIGPMFEHYMRNAMLALMANKDEPGTLVEISRIFTDQDFMEKRLQHVTDPLVRSFWLREWRQTTGQTRSDMLGYVVSKVGRFIENEMMRNIIGQTRSGFDLAKAMDEGKIFLANLSKGRTGEMNSSLLGLILISKMQIGAMQRAKIPENMRKDFYLYIDEFHNFTTDNISTILSEARKYKLNLILAHQYVPQLADTIKNAVFGNVGTIASFRVGPDDAKFMEAQFAPDFSAYDLSNLDNYYFTMKMIINGQISSAFKLKTVKPRKGNEAIVAPIKKISKLKYAKPKKEVEFEINKRWSV